MIEWIILGYITIPTLFNLIVVLHKRKQTLNKIYKNLEEKGYKADQRLKNNIFEAILESGNIPYTVDNYRDELWGSTFLPFIRWLDVCNNIKYLKGNYTGLNEIYTCLEDSTSNENIINYLIRNRLIKVDAEKKNWSFDRDNALKELEKKSENVTVDSEIHTFSNDDKLEELYDKMAELEEIIQRKENSKQKNSGYAKTLGLINKKVGK